MKTYFKTTWFILLLITLSSLVLITPSYSQDIDELTERYRAELQKIQSSEDSQEFFMTHVKDDFGLTNSLIGFLNGLENGAYTKQIEYVMNVPVQRWNPNAGAGGWGRYERGNAVRIVNKNVSGTLTNVNNLMSNIGDAMAIYSIGNDIVQAFYGDDNAKLKALHGTYNFVAGKLTSDFPGMSTAMLGVAFISYALNKFITTTLGEYSDYWWEKYRNYYLNKYPSFVEDWAPLATQEGGFDIIEQRLEEEFWDSDEAILESDDAPTLYSQAEYAKNVMGAGFAAQYYRDFLQRNIESWVRTRTEQGLLDVWSEYRTDSRALQEIVQELETLRELIQFAEREMNERPPVSISISPNQTTLESGETVNFTATAVFEDQTTTNITQTEETTWSTGSNTFTATESGEYEIRVTFRGISAEAIVTVDEKLPVSLTISPDAASLNPGESVSFTALAIFEDGTSTNITDSGATTWSTGSNSFTASGAGEETVTVSYMGLSASAVVTVGEEIAPQCNSPDEVLDEETGNCVCNTAEGYEMNDELGKCINLDEAIDEIAEDGDEALCDEEALAEKLARLDELAASGNRLAADFYSLYSKFMKEINDQKADPCTNSSIAYTYASVKETLPQIQAMADEAESLGTELMLEGALCPLEQIELDVNRILQYVSQTGESIGEIERGIADMENQLLTYGCDEQDISDLGDTIADRTTNPEVLESGAVGMQGNTPGVPGGGFGTGTSGAIRAGYADGPLSSINVTVNFNSRSFNFTLSRGDEEGFFQRFENESIQEGDRVQINIPGTGLNPTITLRESDFITIPGSENRLFGMIILVFFDDDEDQMRYRMSVILGGGEVNPGEGRCLVFPGGGSCQDF